MSNLSPRDLADWWDFADRIRTQPPSPHHGDPFDCDWDRDPEPPVGTAVEDEQLRPDAALEGR